MFFLLQSAETTIGTGYVAALLQSILALGAVCILAWVVLRWSAQRGLGKSRGRMRVIEKLPLEARRSLYLIEVGDRVLLIGTGDGASPALIAELNPESVPEPSTPKSNITSLVAQWQQTSNDAENPDD